MVPLQTRVSACPYLLRFHLGRLGPESICQRVELGQPELTDDMGLRRHQVETVECTRNNQQFGRHSGFNEAAGVVDVLAHKKINRADSDERTRKSIKPS